MTFVQDLPVSSWLLVTASNRSGEGPAGAWRGDLGQPEAAVGPRDVVTVLRAVE